MATIAEFRFESGEVIKDVKVSYVTHGKLTPKKDNVIVVLDSFTSDHHALDYLKGPGKALDADRYFIVSIDGLGNANMRHDITTGPTNSGLKMEFPRYTLRDAVNLEYRLLKEHLGLDHVVAVLGASMGGMKSLQFAVSYPTYVHAIVPIVGGPATSPQIKTMVRNWLDIIALDPAWHGGNYETNPTTGLLTALMNFVPWYFTHQWFVAHARTADEYLVFRKRWNDIWALRSPQDARDIYYRWRAWADFNVGDTPGFKGDTLAALRAIKAQVLIIGSRDDLLVHRDGLIVAKNTIPNATLVELDSPFGHLACCSDPDATKIIDREIAKFLSKLR